MSDKIKRAIEFAKQAHDGVNQKRKYTGEPYWVHCLDVMEIVKTTAHDENMLCAALLHDTVEDTKITLFDIEREFGEDVSTLVEMLTDVSKPADGNRKVRKCIDREHTKKASARAKTIKLADLISNAKDIVKNDKDFARVYLKEKALLLEILKEGNKDLHEEAMSVLYYCWKSSKS